MKVLDGEEKKVYNELLSMIPFEKIDCWDTPIPKSWLNNIKDLKIDESLRWSDNIND